jgi:hypothetical protein
MACPRFGRRGAVLAVLLAGMAAPASLSAQAWVVPRGEGSVSVLYQQTKVRDHVFSDGLTLDVGHILTQAVSLDVDYGITDRVSASASLPFIAARYRGLSPHRHPGLVTVDDGQYHGGTQDVRGDVRYSALELPVAVTPFLAVSIPTRPYAYFGHASIGVRLREVQTGVNVGVLRSPFYAQARYAFGVSERLIGRRRVRSNLDAEVGWFVRPRVRVFAFELAQRTHGGLEILRGLRGLTPEELPHHDRFARANPLDVGGGIAFELSPSTEVAASALTNIGGVNIHASQYAFTAGVSWSFGGRTGHHAPLPAHP